MILLRAAAIQFAFLLLALLPAAAATPGELDRLHAALGTEELLEIMREEGLGQAEELRAEMFPGRGGDTWIGVAGNIYDTGRMSATFRKRFDAELAGADVAPLLEFFGSDLGRRIVRLELDGRRALLADGVEDAAREAFVKLAAADPDRVAVLTDFVEVNDLVEFNVMGAMNANMAFLTALTDGGGVEMAEDDILADVWAQEPAIRDDTTAWILAYLSMAYQPLSDAEIRGYADFSVTPSGRALNTALFAAFDDVFVEVSRGLGRAASRFSAGEEL